MGHIFSQEGLKPDPEKTRAITDMPVPIDSQSLHRYLGMITYLTKFIPRLSEIATPLRQLIKQDSVWHWDNQHQKTFEAINNAISNPPFLKYYDPNKPFKLSCNASKSGLHVGAVLLQNDIPIAYASKALTPTRSLSKLEENDVVRLQTPKGYQIPATVKKCSNEPCSYVVTANNRKYHRNRRHLLKVSEPEHVDQSDDDLARYDIDLDQPPARLVRNR